jgi:hypothetical protein
VRVRASARIASADFWDFVKRTREKTFWIQICQGASQRSGQLSLQLLLLDWGLLVLYINKLCRDNEQLRGLLEQVRTSKSECANAL